MAGRNALFAKQGRASTNAIAEKVRDLFRRDRAMSDYYNHDLSGGKWDHLMDQTHIGQFGWEPPIADAMPAVSELLVEDNAKFGVAIEGDVNIWPGQFGEAVLPAFDSFQRRRSFVEIFAMGRRSIEYSISTKQPWILVTADAEPRLDRRYWVDVDWDRLPAGNSSGTIEIKGDRGTVNVKVNATKATDEQRQAAKGRFASLTGPVAFPAASALKKDVGGVHWDRIPNYGRGDGAMAIYPVDSPSVLPPEASPTLEYPVYLPRAGTYEVTLEVGPVMDFVPNRGMRIAVSFDDEGPKVLDLFAHREEEGFLGKNWTTQVARDNVRYLRSKHVLVAPGQHTLSIAMVDPGIVVQRIVISDGRLPESYFGPPDSDR